MVAAEYKTRNEKSFLQIILLNEGILDSVKPLLSSSV